MKRYIKSSMFSETSAIDKLRKCIKYDDDVIAKFETTSEHRTLYCIAENGSDDADSALEDTLHRLIDNGMESDIYFIMGAYIPDEDEMEELEKFEEYIPVDEGYVISGLITFFEQIDVLPEYYEVTLIDSTDKTETEIVKTDDIQKIYDYYNNNYYLDVGVENIEKCSDDDITYYNKSNTSVLEL